MMDKKMPYIVALLALMFVPLALFGAQAMPLPTLPSVALPNSEVVTNITLNVDYARLESLTFSLELNASASNSLSIAVGTANGDSLSFEDADFEWGYDCGKWFRADTETGNVDEWTEAGMGRGGALGDRALPSVGADHRAARTGNGALGRRLTSDQALPQRFCSFPKQNQ